jgi:O-antigen/teichoic acid export membrane protein
VTDEPHPAASGLRDGIALGVSKLAQAGLALVAQKALLRSESEADFGKWIAFMSVANAAIAFLGWPQVSVLRLGAEEWNETRRLARTFALHGLLLLGSLLFVAAPALEARELIDRYVRIDGATVLVLEYAFLAAAGNVVAAHLKPAQRVAQFALLPLVTRIFWASALGAFAFVLGRDLDARAVMVLCTITAIPQLVVGLGLVARWTVPPARPHAHDSERALRFGLPVLLRQLGTQAFAYVNFVLLYPMLGSIEIAGRFQVGATLSEQAVLFLSALEDLMGPILARAASRGEDRTLRVYYRTLAPQVVLVWSALAGAAILVARPILAALSAKAVDATAPALEVLLLATAARVVVSLEAPVFDAHLISGAPLAFYVIGFATNVGLDLVLIPRFGIEGAAWASLAGWLVNTIARSVYVRAKFRVSVLRLYVWLWPVVAAFLWARLGSEVAFPALARPAALVVFSLALGKVLGVFAPETLVALEGVAMPEKLRRALERAYRT